MENESLDLQEPGGQRWKHVLSAVKQKKSTADVVKEMERKLPRSMRKAFIEFAECGVSFAEMLSNRDDLRKLKELVRKCKQHDYARLFSDTCIAFPETTDKDLIKQYTNSIVDRFQSQIQFRVLGQEWDNVGQLENYFRQARIELNSDIERIALGLSNRPDRLPKAKSRRKDQKIKDAAVLLSTSLLERSKA